MDRRKFLRGLGLFGITVGATTPTVADPKKPKSILAKETIDKLEDSSCQLKLHAAYDPKTKPSSESMYSLINQEYNTNVEVAIKVGPDGNLYVKCNDKWQRVLTT